MTDLTQISEAIGGLKAQVQNMADEQARARGRDGEIFKRLEDIRVVLEVNASIPERLKAVEKITDDYKAMKRLGGYVYAVSIGIAGVIGYVVQFALGWWHKT